jgi:hypothetical protein
MKNDTIAPQPHSAEWFAALFKTDPMLAAYIEDLLIEMGSKEVCSLCGKPPAGNYEITTGHPITLKLCVTCRDGYESTFGGKALPAGE